MAFADVQEKSERTPRPLPRILRMFWAGSVMLFVAMIVVGYIRYRMGFPQPHYNPLGGARYEDLTEYLPTYRLLHTKAFFVGSLATPPVAYPPFGAVMYAFDYWFPNPIGFYLATTLVWLAAGIGECGARW